MTTLSRSAKPLFLTGATATGKTSLAIGLAERLGAEIISMDSMAVYRHMDIGTAKPTAAERRRVPHHLVDVVDPWEEFSLAEYLRAASAAAAGIVARNRTVLFVGGTPLYLKALLRGAASGPQPDPVLREQLQREAARHGAKALHDRLRAVDAAAAERIHRHDLRRIVRALEVFELTGSPISATQVHFRGSSNRHSRVVCVELPRDELYRRIDSRVDLMFQRGLVDEVRRLLQLGRPPSRTARQALGYREVIEHLDGKRTLVETIELVRRRTRQFAKRQLTWFRSLNECRRVCVEPRAESETLMEAITEQWNQDP